MKRLIVFQKIYSMFPAPDIFGINDWYDLNLTVATIVCATFLFYYLKNKTPYTFSFKSILPWAILAAFFGLVGARFLAVVEIYAISNSTELTYTFWQYLFYQAGYSYYGGMILNLVILLGINHFIRSKEFPDVLDRLSLIFCLSYALGRIGCHLSGDGCFGIPTNLPWGIYYSYGPEPTLFPVHPTPIYEFIANIILFFILIRIDQSKKFIGQTLCIYLMASSLLRFSVEFIRLNPDIYMGLSMAQLISIVLFGIGFITYLKTNNTNLHLTPVNLN